MLFAERILSLLEAQRYEVFKDTDFYSAVASGKQMLRTSAVPTHLIPKIKERRILQRELSKYTY